MRESSIDRTVLGQPEHASSNPARGILNYYSKLFEKMLNSILKGSFETLNKLVYLNSFGCGDEGCPSLQVFFQSRLHG